MMMMIVIDIIIYNNKYIINNNDKICYVIVYLFMYLVIRRNRLRGYGPSWVLRKKHGPSTM